MTSEGKAALMGLSMDILGELVKRVIEAVTNESDESWKKLEEIMPRDFKVKLILIHGEEKARRAISDALKSS